MTTTNKLEVDASGLVSMKDRIKEVATEMLIAHGCAGLRFQQIADALQCTRGNIHYHYRHKQLIIEEVTIEYCQRTIERFNEIWNSDLSLSKKIHQSMEFNKVRYLQHNHSGNTSNPWSLIARMRLEQDLITDAARESLRDYSAQLQRCVLNSMKKAVQRGELKPDTPVEIVALPLVELANSADPITRDAGEFDRLRLMYEAFDRLIQDAYGTPKVSSAACPGMND